MSWFFTILGFFVGGAALLYHLATEFKGPSYNVCRVCSTPCDGDYCSENCELQAKVQRGEGPGAKHHIFYKNRDELGF